MLHAKNREAQNYQSNTLFGYDDMKAFLRLLLERPDAIRLSLQAPTYCLINRVLSRI